MDISPSEEMYSSTSKFVDGGNKKNFLKLYSSHRVSNEKLSGNNALKFISAPHCYIRNELSSSVAILRRKQKIIYLSETIHCGTAINSSFK